MQFEEDGTSAQDSSTADEGNQEQTPDVKTFDQKAVDKIVAKRVKEVKSQFADYDELKQRAETLEQQLKSQKEATEERTKKLSGKALGLEITLASQKANLDPKLAEKLLDKEQIHFDENGDPTNLTELFTSLVTEHPQLVKKHITNTTTQEDKKEQPKTFSLNPVRTSSFFQGSGVLFKGND